MGVAGGRIPTELGVHYSNGRNENSLPNCVQTPGWYVAYKEIEPITGLPYLLGTEDCKGGWLNTREEAERAVQSLAEAGITTDEALDALSDEQALYLIYRDLFW